MFIIVTKTVMPSWVFEYYEEEPAHIYDNMITYNCRLCPSSNKVREREMWIGVWTYKDVTKEELYACSSKNHNYYVLNYPESYIKEETIKHYKQVHEFEYEVMEAAKGA